MHGTFRVPSSRPPSKAATLVESVSNSIRVAILSRAPLNARFRDLLPAVQIEVSFASPFPRKMWLHRNHGDFQ